MLYGMRADFSQGDYMGQSGAFPLLNLLASWLSLLPFPVTISHCYHFYLFIDGNQRLEELKCPDAVLNCSNLHFMLIILICFGSFS